MDILVPRGQPSDTFSESHAVLWNVRNVPDNSAVEIEIQTEMKLD